MEIYIIALKELGLDNNTINSMINNLEFDDFIRVFKGKYLEIQFEKNLDLNKYSKKLSDIELMNVAIENAKNILKLNKKYNIKCILINNKNYPINLKYIDDPPVILYYKGKGFYKKHIKSIACVGTRQPSDFSYSAIDYLIPKLVKEEFVIVSGLAEGVDVYSHKSCLDNNGLTIAVLAHGLDTIYPKQNEKVAEEILKKNGLLVSEYPVGTKPDKFRFVDRNRIVSGLSKSVIVFETKEKSGTMHTVNFALRQKKNIFAPMPSKVTPLTSKLCELINSKIAIPIPSRLSYDTVVYGSGYKIKHDKKRVDILKSNNVFNLLSNINVDNKLIFDSINKERNKNTKRKKVSVELDEEIYKQLDDLCKSNNISKKELVNAFISCLNNKA